MQFTSMTNSRVSLFVAGVFLVMEATAADSQTDSRHSVGVGAPIWVGARGTIRGFSRGSAYGPITGDRRATRPILRRWI
jgi:hypothetical protein